MSWRQSVELALAQDRGSSVIVAVSGGSDSVGLLRLLHALQNEIQLTLSAAHLNHGTRGDAAQADADFVAKLAESLGIACDMGQWSPSRTGHFETDARKARYDWLIEIAKQRNATRIAVGHTRDDQAETILHRILRGTGPRGLAGIPRRRDLAEGITLIRPLLDASREEIRQYLAELGQNFREDVSNLVLDHTRNQIRHDLLPKLEREYNPEVREALIRLGALSTDLLDWEEQLELQVEAAKVTIEDRAIALLIEPLKQLPKSVRAEVIRRSWRAAKWPERDMDAKRWLRLALAVEGGPARFSIGGGVDVWMSQDVLRLVLNTPEVDTSVSIPLPIPGIATWEELRVEASFKPASLRECVGVESIDFDCLKPLLTTDGTPVLRIRGARDGDRFEPLGLRGHSQPLNDFFRGRDVALNDRKSVPILCDAEGIVWVVGHRIADRVKQTESTTRILFLRAIRAGSGGQ